MHVGRGWGEPIPEQRKSPGPSEPHPVVYATSPIPRAAKVPVHVRAVGEPQMRQGMYQVMMPGRRRSPGAKAQSRGRSGRWGRAVPVQMCAVPAPSPVAVGGSGGARSRCRCGTACTKGCFQCGDAVPAQMLAVGGAQSQIVAQTSPDWLL
jgi:hypothetical protein